MIGDPAAVAASVVLGIDPGLRICGWGVLRAGTQPEYLASGTIRPRTTDRMEQRLLTINEGVAGLIEQYGVQEVAVEDPFVGALAPASALAIGQARAAALIAAATAGVVAELYTPTAVKAAVAGYGQGDKRQVQSMVKLLLALDQPPEPLDASDALAVALCHLSQRRARAILAGSAAPRVRRG